MFEIVIVLNLMNFCCTQPKSDSMSEGEGKDLINCAFF